MDSIELGKLIAVAVSVIGGLLGLLSFYLIQIKKPHIIAHVEKRIRLGGTGGGGFQFYIPVTFINKSHQTGVILKISLLFFSKNNPDNVYCIDLSRFSEIDDAENKIIDNELPHPLTIGGKSGVYKLLRFTWWNPSTPRLIIGDQEYSVILNLWTSDQKNPDMHVQHSITFSDEQLEFFAKSKMNSSCIEITLDEMPPNNRLLKQREISYLK